MEEGRIRILVCCALALLLIVIGGVGYGVAQIAPPEDDSECIDSWDELLEEYLEFRESSYLLVAPTYDITPTAIGFWQAGEEDPQLDPYWFWHFEGGMYYFSRNSTLGIKDGTRVVLYEDIIKGQIVVLSQNGDAFQEGIVYTAPLPRNKSDDITWAQYLYKEYARRRVVLSLTMRDLRRAKREYLSSQLETDTELVSRAMATRSFGSYTGVWISVEGPGQGACGVEITVHVPEDYTNAVEIYTFEAQPTNQFRGLSNFWTLAATNLIPGTNHTVTWQISDLSGLSNTYLSAGLTGIDADEDTIPDSRELFAHHSNPSLADTDGDYSPDGYEIDHNTDLLSATSFPTVSVSGHVYLPGFGPRTVRVLATASSNEWESAFDTNILLQFVMAGFTITNIPGGGKYWLRAYYDADSSGSADFCDPHGEYTNIWICITNDLSGIDIHLGLDQTDPILQMPSNITIACGESLQPSNTGEAVATDDWSGILLLTYTDTVTVVYSNFNRIIKREWTAEDCCTNSVTQTQTIYQILCDLDMDSLPDEWEQLIVDFDTEDAITNVEDVISGDDFDGDGLTNGEEFDLGSDPTALDSDLDWAGDAYEVEEGTDPVDAFDVPALRMVINDNDLYTHSSWLSLSFPGLVADSMDISESPYMSNSTTAAMSEPTTYILAHETNGLRTIYAELIRTSDGQNSPLLIGSIRLDTEPPTLQITSPTNNWTTSRRWISLEGVATDTVSEVQVLVEGEFADGVLDCEFHHNRYYLEEGSNLVTVLGTDAAGNAVTQMVSIIQDFSNDTNAPVFTMNLPLDYEVSGGVTNWLNTTTYGSNEVLFLNGGIDDETAEIEFLVIADESTNGPFAGRAADTQLWGRVELFPGTNTLVVLADDAAGNVATGIYTIVRNTGMVFEITYPTAYETINAPTVSVHGVASPFFSNAVISVNGIACSVVDNGSNVVFSTVEPVPLNAGRNSIIGVAEVNNRVYYADPEIVGYELIEYSARYNYVWDDSWDYDPPRTFRDWYAWDSDTLIYSYLSYENGFLVTSDTEYTPTLDYEEDFTWCVFGKGTWDLYSTDGDLRHIDHDFSSSLSFIQHWPTEEVQTVIFQFIDMSYDHPPDEELDPSLITYREQTGFWYNGNVSFVVPVKTDTEYPITGSDFTWPDHDYWVITNSGTSIHLDHYFGEYLEFRYCTNEVLSVELKLMWETANMANRIFNLTRKDDPVNDVQVPDDNGDTYGVLRNYLYVVSDPADNHYKVSLDLDIQPTDLRKQFICAAYGASKITGSDTAVPEDPDEAVEMEFYAPSTPLISTIEIKTGLDLNDNGYLDEDEALSLEVYEDPFDGTPQYAFVRGTSDSRYDNAKENVDDIVDGLYSGATSLLLPHAKRLLQIFRDGNAASVPTEMQPTSSSGVSFNAFTGYFAEWLTHNSGASFDDNGNVTLTEYTWNKDTSLAELVATSPQIEDVLTTFYNASVYSDVVTHFASLPVDSSADFPSTTTFYDVTHTSESPSWVTPYTETFDTWLANLIDDVNGTIGRGRLPAHYARYHVEKQSGGLVVTSVKSLGEVIDLYDFNHDVGGAPQDAAILQIGYGNGSYGSARNRGKIFRDRIEFDESYTELP